MQGHERAYRRFAQRLLSVVILVLTALSLSLGAAQAARTLTPVGSGQAIESCMLEDDARYLENSSHFACCSKALGFCVICPQPPSAGNSCQLVSYRTKIPGMNQAPFDPDDFDFGLQQSGPPRSLLETDGADRATQDDKGDPLPLVD